MNRIEMIKAAAKKRIVAPETKPRGMFAEANPERATRIKKRDAVRTSGRLDRGSWGPMERPSGLRYRWVNTPDDAKPIECATKRTKRTNHLTCIAEKWLHKAKRVAQCCTV